MASTPTVLLSISDYGKGIAYEEQRIVLDGGTTAAVFIPSSASKITTIRQICPVNETAANAFKVVKTWSPTDDKEILTITGTANQTYLVSVTGVPA